MEKGDSLGEPQAGATPIDDNEEETDSEHERACGKVTRQHLEHIAERGYVGSFHCGLGHKPGSIQEAMKIPDAKAAVDKELEKVKTIPTWDVKKKRSEV